MFTINRLGLPATLRRSLATTNTVESPNSGVRMRTRRVTNWQVPKAFGTGRIDGAAVGLLRGSLPPRRTSGD